MEEENHDLAVEDIESGGSEGSEDLFINDSEVEEASVSGQDDKGLGIEFWLVEPLTDKEIEELIAEFLKVESKLEIAVADEMAILIEEWKTELDELETESAHLLEQLDGAGIDLPSLYKWIESQAPNGCCTEAWKTRIH